MVQFTRGDTVLISLTAVDGNKVPQDLTGASFTSYLDASNGNVNSYDNSKHTVDPDQNRNRGVYTLQLGVGDTQALQPGDKKNISTKIVIGATVITYRGLGQVTVF